MTVRSMMKHPPPIAGSRSIDRMVRYAGLRHRSYRWIDRTALENSSIVSPPRNMLSTCAGFATRVAPNDLASPFYVEIPVLIERNRGLTYDPIRHGPFKGRSPGGAQHDHSCLATSRPFDPRNSAPEVPAPLSLRPIGVQAPSVRSRVSPG
jgi:hypothetical protein